MIRSTALAACFALSGCVVASAASYQTPVSITPALDNAYPLDANWQILGAGKGESCVDIRGFGATGVARLEPAARYDALYQAAKYAAIEAVPDADNLMYIRSRRELGTERDCVYVTGRAYRIVAARARPAEAGAK